MTDFVSLLPFVLLFTAVVGLWVDRRVWIGAFAASVVAGYWSGALAGLAGVWIAVLAGLAYAFSRASTPMWRGSLGIAVFTWALAMALLLLPGFERTVIAADVVLSPGAASFDLALGFPKVSAGVLILGLIHTERVRSAKELGLVLRRSATPFALALAAVMTLTLAAGYVRFDPKWHALFLAWAPVNLFFTCVAEEAFFRGFVQWRLAKFGETAALIVAAVAFGLAHAGGGWIYVIAATLAGLGYGWAYLRTGRIEAAIAVHFAVNAVHFLLFTYPRVA